MLFVHENNFEEKIKKDYKSQRDSLKKFKEEYYEPFRKAMLNMDFLNATIDTFKNAVKIYNDYAEKLALFSYEHGIMAQSKLESSLLEELSVYLFKDIPEIKQGKLDFYNKGIFAGLKINSDLSLDIIKKDVDFCIGRKIKISIEDQRPIILTVPLVSVEVKTYLDATMFGEVKSSSKTLKSANPNSKAYILMGYKCLADEHILAARQDSTLDEMFVLRKDENMPIDPYALFIYWREVFSAIIGITTDRSLNVPGRLLMYNDLYQQLVSEKQ